MDAIMHAGIGTLGDDRLFEMLVWLWAAHHYGSVG